MADALKDYPIDSAVMLSGAKHLWFPLVMSSEVETSRGETKTIAAGFLDFATLRSE